MIGVMAVFKQIAFAIAMQVSIHASAGAFLTCPQECSCSSGNVTCSGMTSFPVNFPDDTREITITNMNVDALPVDAFSELPLLESIKIYSSQIGRIPSRAFDSLSDIEEIVFSGLEIGLIDSFAFQNLTGVGSIAFKFSSIGVIKSHAFTKFFAFDEISLDFVNATTIESLAFYDIDEIFEFRLKGNKIKKMNRYALANVTNVIDLVVNYNTIDELSFPNFDRMLVDSYRDSMTGNLFPCNCDLVKVLKDVHAKRILSANWCLLKNDGRRSNVVWKDLNEDLLKCRDSDKVLTGNEDVYENLLEDMKSGSPKNENIVTDKTRMDRSHHDQTKMISKIEISTENGRGKGENMTTDASIAEKRDVAVTSLNAIAMQMSIHASAGAFLTCPQECSCSSGNVTCSGMTSFPVNFPDDTREITITNMNVDALPVDAFSELPLLESIKIYSSQIGRIPSRAFDSLSDIEEIVFSGLDIGLIDSFAFQNLTGVGSIAFKFSSIGVIKSHAFTKFFAFDEISLDFVNATTIESLAFYDIDEIFEFRLKGNKIKKMNRYALANVTNVIDLVVKYNTVDELSFPNFDRMLVDSYRDSMIGNLIPCNCDLVKVLKGPQAKRILKANWCLLKNDGRRSNVVWKDLNENLLKCRDSDKVLTGNEDFYENLLEDMKSGSPKNENIVTDKTRMDRYHHDQTKMTSKMEISTENGREKGENMTTDAVIEEKRGDVAVTSLNVIEKTFSSQVTKTSRSMPSSVSNATGEDSGIHSVSDRGRPREKSPGSVAAFQEQPVMNNAGTIRVGMTFVRLFLLTLLHRMLTMYEKS